MSDLEGVMLSDYLLLQCISKGGMADVYRARQNGEENFEVAVKVYRSSFAQQESFRDYFMAEAEKIGQFDHPNILPLLEFGEGDGLLYVVTPYVAPGTLEDLLRRVGGKFSAMQALPILQQLCSAVQYAHDCKVMHGNIKPSNIFVATDGRMLLSDFGVALGYDDSQQSLTRVGWGSAEYTAPEQSLGVLKPASDIYALGVLLFRILTGEPPFTGQTPVEVLLKHVRQQPPSARTLVPSISDAVDGVLKMALQKRADDRFASVEELSTAYLVAVTVSPVASPVAKTASPQTTPPAAEQPFRVINPQTPVPAGHFPIARSERYTPVPAHLTLMPPMPLRSQESLTSPSFLEESLEERNQPFPHGMLDSISDGNGGSTSAVSSTGQRDFLDESSHSGQNRFWSAEPVEWSPIPGVPDNAVPLTAENYLHNKPAMPVIAALPEDQIDPHMPLPPAKDDAPKESQVEQDTKTLLVRLNKALPIVVVILLLLGLLGALLSSFFY
jgi:serine/threonine protein kinase